MASYDVDLNNKRGTKEECGGEVNGRLRKNWHESY